MVEYVSVQFLQENFWCHQNLLCFVGLHLPRSCLILVPYNKTNIPCIVPDNKRRGMEYLLTAMKILSNSKNKIKQKKKKNVSCKYNKSPHTIHSNFLRVSSIYIILASNIQQHKNVAIFRTDN